MTNALRASILITALVAAGAPAAPGTANVQATRSE